MDAPTQPKTIGKYRVDGVLGHGAMGTVVLGHDPDLDRPVAIKTIHAHLLDTEQMQEYLRRFRQEAQAAARASHPSIVTVFDAGVHAGVPYLAMEYVAGRSLKACLTRRERFRPEDAAAILLQVLEALDHAHARGVVHRDIKPANILVLPNGTAKLTDFGVARMDTRGSTQLGAMLGTPAYCAPEQRAGGDVTPRADLYAVGVVLLELVTGLRPDAAEPSAALAGLRRGQPLPVSPRFLAVLEQALAVQPDRRFATAAAMSEALRHSLDDRTIIELISGLEPCRMPPPAPAAPEANRADTDAGPSDTALRRLALDGIEVLLAERLGPLARILVRRYAGQYPDKAELVRCLAVHIHDPDARAGFLTDLRQAGVDTLGAATWAAATGTERHATVVLEPGRAAAGTARGSDDAPQGPVTPARAARLEALLADHLGPLAKLLVRRAMQAEPSEPDLVAALARHIPDTDAQAAFMAATRTR